MTDSAISWLRSEVPEPQPVELPVDKSALIIVDMQNEFVDPKGKIYVGPMVKATIPNIARLLAQARESKMRVIFVEAVYEKDDPRFGEDPKARLDSGGCMRGTWGAETIDALKPIAGEPVIRKASYDCFFGQDMENLLEGFGTFDHVSVHRNRKINDCHVIVTGTVSNVCVDRTVTGFYLRGYDVVVPVDCISAKNDLLQNLALYQFSNLYRAKLTLSSQVKLVNRVLAVQ